jgi:hypothetical protein
MAKQETGEVSTTASANGAIDKNRPTGKFIDFLAREAERQGHTRSFDVMASQLDRILAGESEQEIMEADLYGTRQGKDLVGLEMEIPDQEIRVAPSSPEFDAPLEHYVQFTAIALIDYDESRLTVGEEFLLSTGAPLLIGKLMTWKARNMLPQKVTIKAVKAPEGSVLKFVGIPRRAVPAESA